MFSVLCRRANGIPRLMSIETRVSSSSISVHILSRTSSLLRSPSLSRPLIRNIHSKQKPPPSLTPGKNGNKLGFRHLLKPALFTAAVCGTSFAGAIIWNYERLRNKVMQHRRDGLFVDMPYKGKSGKYRNQLNQLWNSLQPGERVVAGIIGVNIAVFLLWKVAPIAFMYRWFAASPYASPSQWPMLFSMFSHYSTFHIIANMYVLWSFTSPVSGRLGPEQFLAFYFSAGMVSVLASYAFKIASFTSVASLGASGAICGLIAYQCRMNPESRVAIAFVDQIFPHSFSAKSGLIALMTLDVMGIVFRWRVIDHAAHLGGVLFGIFYANFGEGFWAKRRSFVEWYHEIRRKFS